MYEPIERVEPYMTRYWAAHNLLDHTSRGRGGHKRKQKEKAQEQQTFLEELVNEALDELTDDAWRTLYEARLRRQAILFQYAGREQDVALIGAVAAALHPKSGIPVREQAFARAMLSLSIEQGPLRMMVEAIEANDPDAFPVNLFSQD